MFLCGTLVRPRCVVKTVLYASRPVREIRDPPVSIPSPAKIGSNLYGFKGLIPEIPLRTDQITTR